MYRPVVSIDRGSESTLAMPLPGEVAPLEHRAFVMSGRAANDTNGFSLLASSHRGARHPWAFFLASATEYAHLDPAVAPFDWKRPIGVEQMYALMNERLVSAPIGRISVAAFTGFGASRGYGAGDALRVQFALDGYARSLRKLGCCDDFASYSAKNEGGVTQFSVWTTTIEDLPVVAVVSNDKHNYFAQHVQALPFHAGNAATPWVRDVTSIAPFGEGVPAIVSGKMITLRKGGSGPALRNRLAQADGIVARAIRSLLEAMFELGQEADPALPHAATEDQTA